MDILIQESSVNQEKKVVGTQITNEQYNQLKAISEEEFMSISNLLRKIIILYLREQEHDNDAKLREEDK